MTDPQAIPPAEMTIDELRLALAPLVPANAVFDGWSDAALAMAASELGIPADRAALAFPGGPADMIARPLGQGLTETWGQQVIIEHRAGAGGREGGASRARGSGH